MAAINGFDLNVKSVIQTDASQNKIGAVLLQKGWPVCYALLDTEINYSNTERETLHAVRGLEQFNYYFFGKPCTLNTDHKSIF